MRSRILIGLWLIGALALATLSGGSVYINGEEIGSLSSITEGAGGTAIVPTSGITTIGDAAVSDRSLVANDDLKVTGKLQVGGASYFESTVKTYTGFALEGDNKILTIGTSADFQLFYNTYQTPDTTFMGPSDESRSILIAEKGDYNVDFAHAQQTNPTVYIQSADATNINQFISLAHDQTNGVIDVGAGKLTTPDAFQAADYYSGDGTQGVTDATSYWLCTAADCSTKCQVSIKDGLIVGCT